MVASSCLWLFASAECPVQCTRTCSLCAKNPFSSSSVVAAVVLIISQEFVSKRYPMEELRLLLAWRGQGSKGVLLPVLYDLTYQDLLNMIAEYNKEAAAASSSEEQALKRQWARDLGELAGITKDQVLHVTAVTACTRAQGGPACCATKG
jgi:hypothetical protein